MSHQLIKKMITFAKVMVMTSPRYTSIGIIPAREGSTRFPRKPLALLRGIPVVEHVYRHASAVLDNVVIATDSDEIAHVARGFGAEVVMTSAACPNGTARVIEAYLKLGTRCDVIVNIQGDEPLLSDADIQKVAGYAASSPGEVATIVRRLDDDEWPLLEDASAVKAVIDSNGYAMYFSRAAIPHVRGHTMDRWTRLAPCHLHHGIYGFTPTDRVIHLMARSHSPLASAESLEQLAWIEAGLKIKCIATTNRGISIDTPGDIEKAERQLNETN